MKDLKLKQNEVETEAKAETKTKIEPKAGTSQIHFRGIVCVSSHFIPSYHLPTI